MRILLSFLTLIVSATYLSASNINNTVELLEAITKLNQLYSGSQSLDRASYMKNFVGDTIQFYFPEIQYVNNFTLSQPDTIWLKKRPKKNPKERKDYILNHCYKGILVGKGTATPVSEINGKRFGILSVQVIQPSLQLKYGFVMKAVDLENLEVIDISFPDYIPFKVAISSSRKTNSIKSLIGKKFYIIDSYISSTYKAASLKNGAYQLILDGRSSRPLISHVEMSFVDENNSPINFHPQATTFNSNPKQILTVEEYEDMQPRTITSEFNKDLLNDSTPMPFSFGYIIGVTNEPPISFGQKIDQSKSIEDNWKLTFELSDKIVFIGGSLYVNNIKYLKALYRGKAFFIHHKSVTLDEDEKMKLDSLEKCPADIQERFFNKALFFNKMYHLQNLEKAIADMESYAKYGLAIKKWGVYDESAYTDGTGINISFFNPTDKTIKYISFTVQGYNAVDDPVGKPITKRCIGPIDPQESGSYTFEYTWFTDIISYAKIRSITVTYKNGSTKNIANADKIMFTEDINSIIFSTNPVEDLN